MKPSLPVVLLITIFLMSCGSGSPSSSGIDNSGLLENDSNTQIVDGNAVAPNDETSSEFDPSSTSMGQDPLIQITTNVTFDITVPMYQSNELRVEVMWGEVNLPAMWVGDEYWSASGEFPIGTEENLTVTFYDRNGDIELASVSQQFKTGSNSNESLHILADQFDANRFDADDDGTNNLEELAAGTDPLFNEISLLEIRDSATLSWHMMSVSQELEARLGEQRPYLETSTEFIPYSEDDDVVGTSLNTNIDIDTDGSGTASDSSWAPWYNSSHSGTRTRSGNSIKWEGRYTTYDGDYGRGRDFSNEVIFVDGNTRQFIENISDNYSGTYRDTWDLSSNVTGELIEGTSLCKPVFGTLSITFGTNRNGFPFKTTVTTISKAVDDQFWKVVYLNSDNETTEYLARELTLWGSNEDDRKYPTFMCDFVDF